MIGRDATKWRSFTNVEGIGAVTFSAPILALKAILEATSRRSAIGPLQSGF